MANPKRRRSRTRQANVRGHHKIDAVAVSTCSNCGAPVQSHRVCGECGYYRGRQVITV
jgi:large subunit ribosomal protein L32